MGFWEDEELLAPQREAEEAMIRERQAEERDDAIRRGE